MGKYNSSIYRVRPLMEQVEGNQQNFLGLLALVGIGPLGVPQMYRYEGKPCGEMQLKPSQKKSDPGFFLRLHNLAGDQGDDPGGCL